MPPKTSGTEKKSRTAVPIVPPSNPHPGITPDRLKAAIVADATEADIQAENYKTRPAKAPPADDSQDRWLYVFSCAYSATSSR